MNESYNSTKSIAFIDTEVDTKRRKILDIGGVDEKNKQIHSPALDEMLAFIYQKDYLCGHNIILHDLPFIKKATRQDLSHFRIIDTLYLSPLLFPEKPYHKLLKDDKLQTDELNNPLNDAIKAKDLFYDEIATFEELDEDLKLIYFTLLSNQREFSAFFDYVKYSTFRTDTSSQIKVRFKDKICYNSDLEKIIKANPIELAYCLALINTIEKSSITPPWVSKSYPQVERVMYLLRNNHCLTGCSYCDQSLDPKIGLKKHFGFGAYRKYGDKALQEDAVKAAINSKSILAVFPTGGGKSVTFQVPAFMSGESVKGLTVVISPLQSLMKDQVDNLEKNKKTDAVTINGSLDPIERSKSFERVEDGSACLLYISPESLRSKSIERLLLGRNVVRFVIDEAHCFSAWGQDFRVDYLYIGDFIQSYQEKKSLDYNIPVSCFTATAKQAVIQDIISYFKDKLSLDLEIFHSKASRTNLKFHVTELNDEASKYGMVVDLIKGNLVNGKISPTIIYVSRTKKAYQIAERLSKNGYLAKPYHGKMDKQEKSANQDAFMNENNALNIIVATSAFGMGVDKSDVRLVIHYEISDSLENYVQEAGRAGRDEKEADCYALFSEEDLSKHFILLNQTKLHLKEIQQIWKAVKNITRLRSKVSNSALEIARKAGWDENVEDIETRVKTAISALEQAGYLKRTENIHRIYANSILSKNAQDAIDKINLSENFNTKQKQHAVRIIKKLFSSKKRKQTTARADEDAESRIDYISDHLGIVKEEVINVVNLLREEKILADTKDLTAFIKRGENKNRSLKILKSISKIENFLATQFEEKEKSFHLKELNELAEEYGCDDTSPNKIKTIINYWVIKNWIKRKRNDYSKKTQTILSIYSESELKEKLEKRHLIAHFIVEFLYKKSNENLSELEKNKELILVDFSVHELKKEYENQSTLFLLNITLGEVEDALFYLSRIEAIKIEGGFLVIYNQLTIKKLEEDNSKRYNAEDYKQLKQYYNNKVQQIHIVGEYAKKMIEDYEEALQFVDDYFQLNYDTFIVKYFNKRKNEIKMNITPAKFREIFGELSPAQLNIVKDNHSSNIAVLAGPGSGKTKVLVHKLASLLLMEEVKHEQLLMVTFSRAAATEFKHRLLKLIGNAACFIEIKTFHAYCFDLLGKVGTLEKSKDIIENAVKKIEDKDIEINRITKTVLVIDEAQDMDIHEYQLIKVLMESNEQIRVILVGDDDQNIYEFRGASSQYLEQFITEHKAKKRELIQNYRSQSNLVEFTNQFVQKLTHRLKTNPIVSETKELGLVKLINYSSENLINPLVSDIASTDLSGTTCVMAHTNHEALQIAGLLTQKGFTTRLLQSNEDFNLYNLQEVRYFIEQLNMSEDTYTITNERWKEAKRKLKDTYKNSSKIDISLNMIRSFEVSTPKQKYKSDFEVFVRESKLEDFVNADSKKIVVSTIHKSKGKEFDNLFLLLNGFIPDSDAKKRELYVGMTRAKQNLTIHYNGHFLDDISCENMVKKVDNTQYDPSNVLIVQLSYKDLWLSYFKYKQPSISALKSGAKLLVDNEGCSDEKGNIILKFSNSFKAKITDYEGKGYKLTESEVNYIVYWKNEELEYEIKIVLPELKFLKLG